MTFNLIVFIVAVAAGGIASVAGFGIGSLLTPTLGVSVGIKLAVALVSIPHVVGTGVRFALLRRHLSRKVLLTFGIASAVGGLAGALVHTVAHSHWLGVLLGLLLVFASIMQLTGLLKKVHFNRPLAWLAGALSGALGGMVGNQGGIRSAALLAFDIERDAFVSTATAIGLIVDGARMPVYVATQGGEILGHWGVVLITTAGVLVGTLTGKRILGKIPEPTFRRIVALIILGLGISLLAGFGNG